MTRPSWTTHSHAFAGCIQSGTGFPDGWGFGKCVPEFAFGMGCGFRLRALVENATRNLQSEWDAVSQRGRKRKLHPTPDVNSGTRFPDAKKATRRGLQLIYVADTPMTSRAPTTGRLSRRRHIRFIASSARKEGHLMWPSSCAGLSEQGTLYASAWTDVSVVAQQLAASSYLILVVPGARLGSVSLASVWKCSV